MFLLEPCNHKNHLCCILSFLPFVWLFSSLKNIAEILFSVVNDFVSFTVIINAWYYYEVLLMKFDLNELMLLLKKDKHPFSAQ